MKDKSAPNKQRAIVTVSGFAILLVAFAAFSLVPYLKTVSDLKSQIASINADLQKNAQQRAQLEELKPKVQLISMQVSNYDRLVPRNQDLGSFLEQLSQELDNAGLNNTTKRALPPTILGKCQQLPIEIKGTGSYAQFHRFLKRLESLDRMSSVSRLTLESDVPMNGNVTIDLTLSIYNTKPAL